MVGARVKEYFVSYGLKKVMIDEFLASYFKDVGYVDVDLYRTPTGYRVVIYAEYPGRLIGRGGSVIKKLTAILQNRFGLENVNITVSPAPDPELNARIVAYRIVRALEKEIPFRRVMMFMMKRVMQAGAVGAEIIISGKLRGERATYEKLKAGKVYKAGDIADYIVDRAVAAALLKPGIFGVEVVIVKPGFKLPDQVEIRPLPPEEMEKLKPRKAEAAAEGGEAQ